MNNEELSPRDRIMYAAIDCIEKEGIQSLTIRRIAQEAGFNSAAINYYFGSKEKLVERALKQTMDAMPAMPEEILDLEDMDPAARLQAFFEAVMEGIVSWPGITKAHLYDPLIRGNYNTLFVRRFNAFLNDLVSKIKGVRFKGGDEDLQMAVVQIMSAVVMPAIMPRLFRSFAKVDFEDAKTRKLYVANLLRHYFE
jgi:AcrR family transcriptional regulator